VLLLVQLLSVAVLLQVLRALLWLVLASPVSALE
jgi:hypothetical protein